MDAGRGKYLAAGRQVCPDWTEQQALEKRGQHGPLRPLQDSEASLRFVLWGLDSDNGGQLINHHAVAWTGQRPRPIL